MQNTNLLFEAIIFKLASFKLIKLIRHKNTNTDYRKNA